MAAKTIICFDLDGTLADTTEAHAASFQKAFEKNHLAYKTSSEIVAKFGLTAEDIVKDLFPKISKRKLPKVVEDKIEIFVQSDFNLTKPILGVADALQELKKTHKLALVSNAIHEEIIAILKKAGIKPTIFDVILGSHEMDHKPEPQIVKNVEKAVGGKVEYFVGDTIYDVKTGKAAKVKTIAVLSGIHDIKKLGSENPTIIIKSVALLPEMLKGEL
jgi:phosphoglycolate phosphatase